MAWNDLSMSRKAGIIDLAVKEGLTDLNDIINVYEYATGGGLGNPYTRRYKDLPETYKTEISKLAKQANIANVEEAYNSGSLNPLLGIYGFENSGRIRENDSKTVEGSESLENQMNEYIYNGKRHMPNLKYAIPYIEDKEIKIDGVGRTTTNALDSLAKYAAMADVPLVDAIGLGGQETQMGAIPVFNYGQRGVGSRELGNTSYFRNFGLIPAEYLVRDFRYNSVEPGDKFISRDVPPLQHALEYFKAGKYNPKDPNHSSDVRKRGETMLSDPDVQNWLKTSPYAKKAKIR